MIGYIRGVITGVYGEFCFIETGGIGYKVYISASDRESLHTGKEARLITYLAVREDALTLYGFLSQEAYDLFLMLLSISKIGPKLAMGILSSVRPSDFAGAVRNKNVTVLTRIPGIGKKTAERLVLELKDKMGSFGGEEDGPAPSEALSESAADEAAAALCSLGYTEEEVRPVVAALASSIGETGRLIRAALRELGKARVEHGQRN